MGQSDFGPASQNARDKEIREVAGLPTTRRFVDLEAALQDTSLLRGTRAHSSV